MSRLVIAIILLGLLVGAGCTTQTTEYTESTDCPSGNVDCEYPGSCGRYIDANENGICDYSE